MDKMTIDHTVINHSQLNIPGQMGHIAFALKALRQDPRLPPINVLSPGQLYKRIDKFTIKERPSRSTFERFRRQYGAIFGIR